MDEKDRQIARAVALKAAVEWKREGAVAELLHFAEQFEGWLLRPHQAHSEPREAPPQYHPDDPRPAEWPEEGGFQNAPPQAPRCKGCGSTMSYKSGTTDGKDWAGWLCDAKKKDDPKDKHPAVWV